jgi:hypothetical protein
MLQRLRLALDRSLRRYDADGHLHVEMANISKANVCPYFGREIPDFEALGLQPDKVYHLYRDPEELKRAAPTFAGKPLLLHHTPVTADAPSQDLVVGSVGTAVDFDGTYLKAPLVVWTRDAIEVVQTGEQRELSPGYRYRADMTPGRTPEGVAFDGRMRDIMGNHVALVAEGRTGPDVVVPDEMPVEFSTMRFSKVMAALAAILPTMKPEQAIALDSALGEDLKRVKVEHCVEDEFPDLSEDERKAALDKYAKDSGKAMDAFTDEDKKEAYKRAAADKGTVPERKPGGQAADEATVKLAVDAAVAAAIKDMVPKADADKLAQDAATAARAEVHALYSARKAVEATVGVVALDSAEAVYRFALDHLKVDHKEVPAAALSALYEASAKAAAAPAAQIAQDAAPFDPTILGLSHIRKG